MADFVAYIHSRPDGTPFYVGKGTPKRARDFGNDRNPHYLRTVALAGGGSRVLVQRLACSTEKAALSLERVLIKALRISGARLTNLTDGGDGTSGNKQSSETIAKRVAKITGRRHSPEAIERMCNAQKGRTFSPDAINKMKAADRSYVRKMCGPLHPNYGKASSSIQKKAVSVAQKGVPKIKVGCVVCHAVVTVNTFSRHLQGRLCEIYAESRK